jgi:short-subunit dehydrogenase
MALSTTNKIEANRLNVSIIGENGDLASALNKKLITDHNVICYGKDKYNFLNKNDIIDLVSIIFESDIIVCCVGVTTSTDIWDMFTVNAVAPSFLLEKLIEKQSQAHIIIVGSHGAMWTSWPGISLERLSYNVSKETIQSFTTGLSQSNISKLKLSMFNPSRFQNKSNGSQGYPIDIIVDGIIHVIESPTPLLIYEYNNYQHVD